MGCSEVVEPTPSRSLLKIDGGDAGSKSLQEMRPWERQVVGATRDPLDACDEVSGRCADLLIADGATQAKRGLIKNKVGEYVAPRIPQTLRSC